MQDTEFIERLLETEQRSKSNMKRIDEIETEVKENRELTIAVKEIATEMKYLREEQSNMREEQSNMNNRLKIIEEKPIKDYEETKSKMKWQIISFVLGIILMFLAFKLGLKDYI